MRKKDGFGTVGVIITVVTLLIVGGGGTYYAQSEIGERQIQDLLEVVSDVLETEEESGDENQEGSDFGEVSVTSPDESSVWNAGSTYSIEWNASAMINTRDDTVRITLLTAEGGREVIEGFTPNSGTFLWTISDQIPTGDYQIEIGCIIISEALFCSGGTSEQFRINNGAGVESASINILSPKGGETWKVGETYTIAWERKNFPILIEEDKETGKLMEVVPGIHRASYNTAGFYELFEIAGSSMFETDENIAGTSDVLAWTIPDHVVPGSYQIQITCLPAVHVYGCVDVVSEVFEIVAADPDTLEINVILPEPNTMWEKDINYDIEWATENLSSDVWITLSLGEGPSPWSWSLGKNDGSQKIKVPGTILSGTYTLLLTASENQKTIAWGQESVISISGVDLPPEDDAVIEEPGDGDTWTLGDTETVKWSRFLYEVDTDVHDYCEAAYVAVLDADSSSVEGYAFLIDTAKTITGQVWSVGKVSKVRCGGGGDNILTLSPGDYQMQLSYVDPITNERVETTGEVFSLDD